jgi:urease beta subunit
MKRLIILFILSALSLQSQSISIFDIDTTNFPTMRAKFFAFDAAGNQARPSASELTLTEDGVNRVITNVSCPNLRYTLSACIMVDTYAYIDLARKGAERFVSFLQMPPDEVGITYMAGAPLIHRDFTRDRTKAVNATTTIPSAPGVDIQRMFYAEKTGGVPFITPRKNERKALILISDLHCPNLNLDEKRLYADAKANGIRVFSVLLKNTDYTGIFKRLAQNTQGEVFENVRSEDQIYNVLEEIVRKIYLDPCTIEWQSDGACELTRELEFKWNSALDKEMYKTPYNGIASLEVRPNIISFGTKLPATTNDTTITIIAKNSDFTITNINRKYGSSDFSVVNTIFPIVIPKNTSTSITVRFNPLDSSLKYGSFEIQTDKCSGYFSAYGGFPKVKSKVKTLKLTKPNGGETFIAGSDTIITWEGIAPTDTVSLDYSIDSGKTWNNITNKAAGLKYKWVNIPLPASTKCLVRISQSEDGKSYKDEPSLVWQKNYGGGEDETAYSFIKTTDGNLIITGTSSSSNGDITKNNGGEDAWVIKVNSNNGEIIWQKIFGGASIDVIASVKETKDGNIVAVGYTYSSEGDILINNGLCDFWVMKLNSFDGSIYWQKTYGANGNDMLSDIIETKDGNFVAIGTTSSSSGDGTIFKGYFDSWLFKIDSKDGSIIWKKNYGGREQDFVNSIVETNDGNLFVIGYTNSKDGDVINNELGAAIWLLKLNPQDGKIIWQRTYGGSKSDVSTKIIKLRDGNFVIAGYSASNNGDLTVNYGVEDCWLLKVSPLNGNIIWQKSYGGINMDYPSSIIETLDGNLIFVGSSKSYDNFIVINKIDYDYLVIKVNSINGSIIWQKRYAGSKDDFARSILEMENGDLFISGTSESNDKDFINNKGKKDIWIFYLENSTLSLQSDTSDAVFSIIAPDMLLKVKDIDMGRVLVGSSVDKTETEVICNNGTAPLHVLGLDVTNGNTSEFAVPRGAGDFFLAPGDCQAITFQFSPTQVGQRNAKITVRSTIGNKVDSINIRGEGVRPNVTLNTQIVDMGDVLVNTEKDSIVVAVKNTGSAPIKVKPVQYLENNDLFAFDGKDVEFDLAANSSKSLTLYFKPKEQGSVTGRIGFEYNGVGSPLVMLLFGTGIDEKKAIAQAISKVIDFGNVEIGTSKTLTDENTIKNIGNIVLNIKDIKHDAISSEYFKTEKSVNITSLKPNEVSKMDLSFTPDRLGPFTGQLIFTHDGEGTFTNIELRGNGVNNIKPQVQVINKEINFGNVEIGTSKPLFNQETIMNIGNADLNVTQIKWNNASSKDLGITSGNGTFNLTPNSRTYVDINFTPTQLGLASGTIEYYHNASIEPSYVLVKGIGVNNIKPQVQVINNEINFGNVELGTTKPLFNQETIMNIGNADLNVTQIKWNNTSSKDFGITSGNSTFTLSPNTRTYVNVNYTPTQLGFASGTIEYYHNASIEPSYVLVKGNGVLGISPSASISIDSYSAEAGGKISTNLVLDYEYNLTNVTTLSLDLKYNRTLLRPIGNYNPINNGDKATINLNIPYNKQKAGETLTNIDFEVALGNAQGCELTLTNPKSNDNNAVIYAKSGTFSLLGICEDGGARLINPELQARIMSISPNPTNDNFNVEVSLIEAAPSELILLNSLGQQVMTILSTTDTGKHTKSVNTDQLSTGIYYLQLRTATYIENKVIRVEK